MMTSKKGAKRGHPIGKRGRQAPAREMIITFFDDRSAEVTGIPEDYQAAMDMLRAAANVIIDRFGKAAIETVANASSRPKREAPPVGGKAQHPSEGEAGVSDSEDTISRLALTVCPSCHTQLRESLINDDYIICPSCEILFRKETTCISPTAPSLGNNYRNRAMEILCTDRRHYEAFYSNPIIVEKFRIPLLYRDYVLAIGGGHPKLESYLRPKKIEVCDFFPEVYLELLDDFKVLYTYDGEILYRKQKVDATFSFPELSAPEKSLITFVHFLEHMSYDVIIKLLKALPANTDVVIYGPNAEAKPMTKQWFHFSQQHLTLIPLKRFRQIILDMGYRIKYETPFALDMLILFNTGNKAGSSEPSFHSA
jgi:DNA-directed RNA polymerase subunit RPC12/RpoP